MNSVAVDSSPTAVSAVVVVVPSNPARVSISNCAAPPVAAPPGSARLSELPVSCAHATSNQRSVRSAIRMSSQIETNANASSTKIGTNHRGKTDGELRDVAEGRDERRGHDVERHAGDHQHHDPGDHRAARAPHRRVSFPLGDHDSASRNCRVPSAVVEHRRGPDDRRPTEPEALRSRLAAPPRPPADPDLFSSNTLFGEPGIYPQGSPMVPAAGAAPSEAEASGALAELGIADPAAPLGDARLVERVADAGVRAGLLALTVTVAAPLVAAFVDGVTPVQSMRYGEPSSPGRIVGPPAGAASTTSERVVNVRYRAEEPALLAGSLAHDLLWSPECAGQYEEVTLHALCAMVHVQLLARVQRLARTGTELARRQNSLAITLLNSRHPGSADIALVATDGPGTIPGGAPSMQTPDFWSIPFVSGPHQASDVPSSFGSVLANLAPDVIPPAPLRYDDDLGTWLSTHLGREWLPLDAQLRAAVTLGMLDVT